MDSFVDAFFEEVFFSENSSGHCLIEYAQKPQKLELRGPRTLAIRVFPLRGRIELSSPTLVDDSKRVQFSLDNLDAEEEGGHVGLVAAPPHLPGWIEQDPESGAFRAHVSSSKAEP
jgi:hypothetical protein